MLKVMSGRRREIVTGLIVVLLSTSELSMATVDSNSIIRDGIEYYIRTDKSFYNLGENVEMLYRVTNLKDENVTFNFSAYPVYQFGVEKDRELIWSAPKFWLPIVTKLTLLPGEIREFPDDFPPPFIWNMRNNQNGLVNLGTYSIIGGLYDGLGTYDYTKVSVPIDVIPEPASFILLGFGFMTIFRQRHCRSILP
jgi:hypothetical protein